MFCSTPILPDSVRPAPPPPVRPGLHLPVGNLRADWPKWEFLAQKYKYNKVEGSNGGLGYAAG